MDVAGVALAVVGLGHEGDRAAEVGGDHLRAGLVDAVVVRGGDDVVEEEADLVLAEVALALGRLHHHAGGVHVAADPSQDRLDAARSHHRVVDVVLVGRRQVAVALGPRLLIAVAVDHELQLGPGHGLPAALGGLVDLRAEHRPRRHRHRLAVGGRQVALHHHRPVEPRHPPDGVEVEHELHVAVAGVPRGDRVAVDGVHLGVDGEEVVAPLDPVLERVLEEVGGVQELPLQPALHVGEGDDDGLDLARRDGGPHLVDGEHPGTARVVVLGHR